MHRIASALIVFSSLLLLRSDSALHRERMRDAADFSSQQIADWIGDAVPPPAPSIRTGWLLSIFDVGAETATARLVVDRAVGDLFADRELNRQLTNFLTGRIGEALFQRNTGSPSGAGFVIASYFGGSVPYAIRSIRLDREDLGRADVFVALEREIGWPALEDVLKRFRAAHPGGAVPTDEFVRFAGEATGRDLTWLFRAMLDDAVADYGVQQVTELPGSHGRHRTVVVVRRFGDVIVAGSGRARSGPYESGDAIEVSVRFADGVERREHWDGRDRWTTFDYDSATPVESVIVDPRRVVVADRTRTNNTWTGHPAAAAAANKWSARWMTWLQGALLNWAFFA